MSIFHILLISFRNFMSGKSRTVLTVSAFAIGFATVTFLLSIGYGIEKMTASQISSPNTLYIFDVSLDDTDLSSIEEKNLQEIKNLDNVEKVEPALVLPGKINNGSIKADVAVYGYSTEYLSMSEIKISEGGDLGEKNKKDVLVSTGALSALNLEGAEFKRANVNVDVMTNSALSPKLQTEESENIKNINISGTVDDKTPFIIFPIETLKEIFGTTNYSAAKVKVKDRAKISDARRLVEKLGFSTVYVGDAIAQINTFFSIFRYIISSFGIIAMVVAILGMFNTLTVSLIERTQEIGILKSNGAKRRDVLMLFLTESLLISFMGGFLGIIFGTLSAEGINFLFNVYAVKNGGISVNFSFLPLLSVLYMVLTILAVGILTGLYPARRASQIRILDAIKYE